MRNEYHKKWQRVNRYGIPVDGLPVQVCLGCGVLFQPRTKKQIYHNKECGVSYKNKLKREENARKKAEADKYYSPVIKDDIIMLPLGGRYRGQYAIIDNHPDNIYIGKYKFSCDAYGYPMTTYLRKPTHLHHMILGKPPKGKVVDHINNNRLDCRFENLRIIGKGHNNYNKRSTRSDNISGYTGVNFEGKKWNARIWKDGKRYNLGYYDTFLEAVRARKKAEEELYGSSPHFYTEDDYGDKRK